MKNLSFFDYLSVFRSRKGDRPFQRKLYSILCYYAVLRHDATLTPRTRVHELTDESRLSGRPNFRRFHKIAVVASKHCLLDIETEPYTEAKGQRLYDSFRGWLSEEAGSSNELPYSLIYYLRSCDITRKMILQLERDTLGKTIEEMSRREIAVCLKHPIKNPTDVKMQPSSRIDPGWEQRKEAVDRFISGSLQDYVPHPACQAIVQILDETECAHILVTAGPGEGKSGLIAEFCRECLEILPESEGVVIPFFFQKGSARISDGRTDTFWCYLLSQMARYYFDPYLVSESREQPQNEIFRRQIYALSDSGRISFVNPLVVVIDALDEIDGIPGSSAKLNPLGLPVDLPDGVFIVQSLRFSGDPEHLERSAYSERVLCHVAMREVDHERTVREYALQQFRNRRHLELVAERYPYFRSDSVDDLIERVCKHAKYNFMLTKCILNDPANWVSPVSWMSVPRDIEGYYEQHVQRMKKHGGAAVDALIKLSLVADLSRLCLTEAFARRFPRKDVVDALEIWVDQGLVVEDRVSDRQTNMVYHRTYREFLHDRTKSSDFVDDIQAAALRLVPDLDSIVEEICSIVDGESRHDLFLLVLLLSKRAKMPNVWDVCLLNESIWYGTRGNRSGSLRALSAIAVVDERTSLRERYEAIFRRLAPLLLNLQIERKLYKNSNENMSLSDLQRHLSQCAQDWGHISSEPLYLEDFLYRAITDGGVLDE